MSLVLAFITPAQADPLSGLDSRPANTTCLAGDVPRSAPILVDAFSQTWPFLPFDMRVSPGDPNRWYFITRSGKIYTFVAPDGAPQLVLDIADRIGVLNSTTAYAPGGSEQWGLSSLALDPNFATNGQVFVLYTGRQATETIPTSVVARYTSTGDGTLFDRQTEKLIISQQQTQGVNHHFGNLTFGPDGFLYIGSGDGSALASASPAQNCADLRGKILRLDVNTSAAYAIPADNPFVGNSACRPEVYALGLRNPWRFSFDPQTGKLWVGDVGANLAEEVNVVANGGNYGWPIVEGIQCRITSQCGNSALLPPVYVFPHNSQPSALIGGAVYRGKDLPSLVGDYLFSIFSQQQLNSLQKNGTTDTWSGQTLLTGVPSFSSHFADRDGEFYGITGQSSNPVIRKLVPDPAASADATIPAVLSATGCVNPANPQQVVPAAIPYSIASPLWSDGAAKRRWAALPDGAKITIAADGDFQFPVNSVLIKEFSFAGKPFETRLLKHHTDGTWVGYTYEWRSDLSDADLVPSSGLTKVVTTGLGTSVNWTYPSRQQCLVCHNEAANFALGPEIQQLNHISATAYLQTGRSGNELSSWAAIGLFDAPLPAPVAHLRVLANPSDTLAPRTLRARSYLHANCAGCHRPDGPTRTDLDFRYTTATSAMNACGVPPAAGDLGVAGAMPIVAQNRKLSLVFLRMNRRDLYQMPPTGTTLVDSTGTGVISNWIRLADVCNNLPDGDGDGVPDNSDNCSEKYNPDQADSNRNRTGNRCDGDFTNDGIVNASDREKMMVRLGTRFQGTAWVPKYDLNGDGTVDQTDLEIFDTELMGSPPGPSALRP